MRIFAPPRRLLGDKVDLRELEDAEQCCGFGGAFCVKFPEISERMASEKSAHIAESGAEWLVSGDVGCLLNIAGRMHREGRKIHAFHIADGKVDYRNRWVRTAKFRIEDREGRAVVNAMNPFDCEPEYSDFVLVDKEGLASTALVWHGGTP